MSIAITKPGVYDLDRDIYDADPCPAPSLRSSIAHTLIEKTPRHAWMQHPRLNENHEQKTAAHFDLGSAVHMHMLEGESKFAIIEADDWRKKEAKELRDDAREKGLIPLLAKDHEKVIAMAKAFFLQIEHHDDAAGCFQNGKPEQTLIWQEKNGVWCRCLLDWNPNKGNIFHDYKTTASSASADVWGQRSLFDFGGDMQAAFYLRGIRKALGKSQAHFRFVVQETEPPYALNVIALDPASLGMAERKVKHAIRMWGWCLGKNFWPGYPRQTCYVDAPPWVQNRWLAAESREEIEKEQGRDVLETMIKWQGTGA